LLDDNDVPLARFVVFVKSESNCHIQKMTNGRIRISRSLDLRQVIDNGAVRVEQASPDQYTGEHPRHGLRNRKKDMGNMRLKTRMVTLIHQLSATEHDHPIRHGAL
jgi:hypothetical protein